MFTMGKVSIELTNQGLGRKSIFTQFICFEFGVWNNTVNWKRIADGKKKQLDLYENTVKVK